MKLITLAIKVNQAILSCVLGFIILLVAACGASAFTGSAPKSVQTPPPSLPPYPCLYTGEQIDPDLGMYYLRARYYQPGLGRFWSLDSYEGSQETSLSLHKYLYCHGNPVNGVDPTGHDFSCISIGSSMSIMGQTGTHELRGGHAALVGARAMFGADGGVNDLIAGLDYINIFDEKVGQIALGGAALYGGIRLVNFVKNVITGPWGGAVANRIAVSLQNLSRAGVKCGGSGDCVPMAAGVAEALRGRTIPVNPPAWFKQTWLNPGVLEDHFASRFSGLYRSADEARGAIAGILAQSGGDGAHGLVIGSKQGSSTQHVFNVILEGGQLKVIDVSSAGTGFDGLTSIQFMLVK